MKAIYIFHPFFVWGIALIGVPLAMVAGVFAMAGVFGSVYMLAGLL